MVALYYPKIATGWRLLLCLFAGGVCSSAGAVDTPRDHELFERRIRPVLAEQCYTCHSATSKKLKGDLLLDSRPRMLQGGDTGPAIEPGNADTSLLIEAIRYTDVNLQMPPTEKLSEQTIRDFEDWVSLGAPWPDEPEPEANANLRATFDLSERKAAHWSWQPLRNVAIPEGPTGQSPTDRFIRARLAEKHLRPAPETDKRTWLRRVHFDLLGLPPSSEDLQSFLADTSEQAYERRVDLLLASPHFGERWGRHWLDLVRYAESCGHEFDYELQHAHKYRDYIIRAFNANVPYDQLLTEHIAGDLLTDPRRHPTDDTNESILGTGFWFLHEAVHAPTDVKADEADRIDNQIDVFSKSFLGLTVACARCHDHKFDPIPTSDYYALSGFLQSTRRQTAMLDPNQRIANIARELAAIHQDLQATEPDPTQTATYIEQAQSLMDLHAGGEKHPDIDLLIAQTSKALNLDPALLKRWQETLQQKSAAKPEHPLFAWNLLSRNENPETRWATFNRRLDKSPENTSGKTGPDWTFDQGDFNGWFATGYAFGNAPVNGLADSGHLSNKLEGVLRSPTFALQEGSVFLHLNGGGEGVRARLIIDGYQMEQFNGLLFGGTHLKKIDTKGAFQWLKLGNAMYTGHRAYVEIIDQGSGSIQIDRVVQSLGAPPPPTHAVTLAVQAAQPDTREKLLAIYTDQARSGTFRQWLIENQLASTPAPRIQTLVQRKAELEKELPKPTYALAMAEGTGENEYVFIRGKHTNRGAEAPRRFLQAIAGEQQAPITDGSGRMELVERILAPNNPYPARVFVNRIWHHLFARGLVSSVDDFGAMGRPPSHPDLLDWLAVDFREHGWDIKRAIRNIVLTDTYRMSSAPLHADPKAAELDPENILLHRMPIRRLQAEAIRDAVLQISGTLNPTMYGPAIPVNLTSFQNGRGRPKSGPVDGNGRRSLYLSVRRNFLSSMMLTFDFPTPFSSMGRRTVSNVPAQALVMMNHPLMQEQAKLWAKRAIAQTQDPNARLDLLFEEAFARPATPEERRQLDAFRTSQGKLLGVQADHEQVWADLCHVLMNKKEFIYLN